MLDESGIGEEGEFGGTGGVERWLFWMEGARMLVSYRLEEAQGITCQFSDHRL